MAPGLALQLCGAFVVAVAGLLLVLVGAYASGAVLVIGGGAWLVRCITRV